MDNSAGGGGGRGAGGRVGGRGGEQRHPGGGAGDQEQAASEQVHGGGSFGGQAERGAGRVGGSTGWRGLVSTSSAGTPLRAAALAWDPDRGQATTGIPGSLAASGRPGRNGRPVWAGPQPAPTLMLPVATGVSPDTRMTVRHSPIASGCYPPTERKPSRSGARRGVSAPDGKRAATSVRGTSRYSTLNIFRMSPPWRNRLRGVTPIDTFQRCW